MLDLPPRATSCTNVLDIAEDHLALRVMIVPLSLFFASLKSTGIAPSQVSPANEIAAWVERGRP